MNNPQNTADLIKRLADSTGVSISKLLLDCQMNKNALFTMQNSGYFPRVEALSRIADYFDVSIDYLLGRTDVPEVNRGDSMPLAAYGEIAAFGGKTTRPAMVEDEPETTAKKSR